MTHGRVLLDAGCLADAAVEARALLEMVDELGPGNFADIAALYTLLRVAIYEGDDEALERLGREAIRMMRDESVRIRNQGSWVASLIAEHRGDVRSEIDTDERGTLQHRLEENRESGGCKLVLAWMVSCLRQHRYGAKT